VRADQPLEEHLVFVTWKGTAGSLSLGFDPLAGTFYLEDHLGRRVTLVFVLLAGDVVTFGISQNAAERALFAASTATGAIAAASAALPPIGAFSTVHLYPA